MQPGYSEVQGTEMVDSDMVSGTGRGCDDSITEILILKGFVKKRYIGYHRPSANFKKGDNLETERRQGGADNIKIVYRNRILWLRLELTGS
jgi:hypothetical protein